MTHRPAYDQLRKMVHMATADSWTSPSIVDDRTQKLYDALLAEAGIRDAGQPAVSTSYARLQAVATKTNREMAAATLRAYKRIHQLASTATGPIDPSEILDALKDPEPDPARLAAPTNPDTEARTAILREAADFIDKRQDQMDEEIRAEYSELDRDTEVEGAATRRMATALRRLAAGAES